MKAADGLEIRDAREDDHGSFLRLVPELGVDDPLPDFERWSSLVRPTMLLAERGSEVLGYTYYRPLDGTMHLAHVVTAPTARRSGVGRALIAEAIRRGKAAGATSLYLNVKPQNAAAIALYSSFGLRRVARTWAFRLPWAAVLAQPAPFLAEAQALEAADDAAAEARHALAKGVLAAHRKQAERRIHAIGDDAIASFDPGFGGANPFVATSIAHAFSLLHALRPFARPEHESIAFTIDDREDHADAMLAAGATLRLRTERMSGPI